MTTFATPEPITATLTTAGARVRITAGDRPETVVLVEPIDGTDKSDVRVAANTKVDFAAGELTIKTTKSGRKEGSVAITVELPAGSRLVLSTAWTDVQADGRFGDCTLDVSSGRVRLDRIASLRAGLAAGDVEIGHIAGRADIHGGAAGVRIRKADGLVKYQGSTGRVWIGHALAGVDLGSARGGFDIDRADADVTAKAGDCPIRIGHLTRGQADLTNASGGIDLGIGSGAAATVDAKSTKGQVRNSLPTAAGAAALTIYARTRRDDITIHPAA